MQCHTIMIQGTNSNAGKSTVATGICRLLQRRGIRVAPFKPQNMALNSAVTPEGGEIGRAQAVQAQACGIAPHTDMNPILLKPSSAVGAQVIVNGKALSQMNAIEYHKFKPSLLPDILAAYKRLCQKYDAIVVEGAGSPAEINLREGDLANMGFALPTKSPVVIVADIDRGGVFAHLVGTFQLLASEEQDLVKGFIINKFRGDPALLQSGIEWLEEYTHKPVLGILPYITDLHLEAEDSLSDHKTAGTTSATTLNIAITRLPHMSNATDFHALELNPQLNAYFATSPADASKCDLLILPGSKSVRDDLEWIKNSGWTKFIQRHLRYGGKVMGICGGFQMLGKLIHDPHGIESEAGTTPGLALLDMETTIQPTKQLKQVSGSLVFDGCSVSGYEIHMGTTSGDALKSPLIKLTAGNDGAISPDGSVIGTYFHGLFDEGPACRSLLSWAGLENPAELDYVALREQGIDNLANILESHLDVNRLLEISAVPPLSRDLLHKF
jgi:adenosylcobyric acid synthase